MMKKTNLEDMPQEYGYLNAPLDRAQEHVFLINAEIERLEGNPMNEYQLIKLQNEKSTVVRNLKNEFELQTFEDGPAYSEGIANLVDRKLGDDAYKAAKTKLAASGKTYNTSSYWEDKFDRNMGEWHKNYGVHEGFVDLNNYFYDIPDIYDDLEDLDKE